VISNIGFLRRKVEIILLFVLFFFGIIISLYYGRKGFMPFDQSIVFDGGLRILSGQVPFRDFNTPNAFVPILLQAIFFKIFGVNWFCYCFHAAFFNGIFCILVYLLLRCLGGAKIISFFYAFLSSLIYYPPMGVPFMDQHAFFFILLAIVMSVRASQGGANLVRILFWLMIPLAIILAYLSKQNPTLLIVPAILFILFIMTEKKWHKVMFFFLSIGLVVSILCCLMIFKIYHMDYADFKVYFFELPFNIGTQRFKSLITHPYLSLVRVFFNQTWFHPWETQWPWLSVSPILIYLSSIFILFKSHYKPNNLKEARKLLIPLLIVLICSFSSQLTLVAKSVEMPYLFASLGIVHIVYMKILETNKHFSHFLNVRKNFVPGTVINIIFICVALLDAFVFNYKVNETRYFLISSRKNLAEQSSVLPKELNFMLFDKPYYMHKYPDTKYEAKDLRQSIDFLKGQKENFFLLGDTSILYGLTNKPSINPSLWFHPGLTYPLDNNFQLYENKIIDNLQKYKVKFIVFEGNNTLHGISLDNFPRLKFLVDTKGYLFRVFGSFKVFRLSF
jgi:hypothetical protein